MRGALGLLFFGVLGACLAFVALAQSNEEPQKKWPETTLSDLKEELGVKVQKAEDKLQHLLAELKTVLPKEAWSDLKSVQARWEEFKHKDCAWKRQLFQEGSVAPVVYGRCLETHIDVNMSQPAVLCLLYTPVARTVRELTWNCHQAGSRRWLNGAGLSCRGREYSGGVRYPVFPHSG